MLIPGMNTFKTDDFTSEQSWIGKLLQPLNSFMEAVTQAVNGNITFGDNIPGQTITLQFVYNGPTEFPKRVKWNLPNGVVPTEVRVCSATEEGIPIAVVPAWSFENGNIIFAGLVRVSTDGYGPLTKGSSYKIIMRGQP